MASVARATSLTRGRCLHVCSFPQPRVTSLGPRDAAAVDELELKASEATSDEAPKNQMNLVLDEDLFDMLIGFDGNNTPRERQQPTARTVPQLTQSVPLAAAAPAYVPRSNTPPAGVDGTASVTAAPAEATGPPPPPPAKSRSGRSLAPKRTVYPGEESAAQQLSSATAKPRRPDPRGTWRGGKSGSSANKAKASVGASLSASAKLQQQVASAASVFAKAAGAKAGGSKKVSKPGPAARAAAKAAAAAAAKAAAAAAAGSDRRSNASDRSHSSSPSTEIWAPQLLDFPPGADQHLGGMSLDSTMLSGDSPRGSLDGSVPHPFVISPEPKRSHSKPRAGKRDDLSNMVYEDYLQYAAEDLSGGEDALELGDTPLSAWGHGLVPPL